jgi:hypothetical protein
MTSASIDGATVLIPPPAGTELALFITAPQGIEPPLAAELVILGATDPKISHGGVSIHCDWTIACRICLWSRLANRVLLPLLRTELDSADTLYAKRQPSTGPLGLISAAPLRSRSPAPAQQFSIPISPPSV